VRIVRFRTAGHNAAFRSRHGRTAGMAVPNRRFGSARPAVRTCKPAGRRCQPAG
jgi:hypothetical protein